MKQENKHRKIGDCVLPSQKLKFVGGTYSCNCSDGKDESRILPLVSAQIKTNGTEFFQQSQDTKLFLRIRLFLQRSSKMIEIDRKSIVCVYMRWNLLFQLHPVVISQTISWVSQERLATVA